MIKLWLDDMRPAPEGWEWARTVEEAQAILLSMPVEEASLDHDLGACPACMNGLTQEQWLVATDYSQMPNCDHFGTGYTLVCWMEERDIWPRQKPLVHSRNPAGASRMRAAINRKYGP